MIALWFGASALLVLPGVLRIIGLVGGASLVVFGILGLHATRRGSDSFTSSFHGQDESEERGRVASLRRPLVMGFVLSATSSGWWAWWASIGLNAIAISSVFVFSSFAVFLTFFTGHLASDFAWYGLVSGLVSGSKRVITARVYAVILVATNVFLVVIGVMFITMALG